jgi:hypothetical protein
LLQLAIRIRLGNNSGAAEINLGACFSRYLGLGCDSRCCNGGNSGSIGRHNRTRGRNCHGQHQPGGSERNTGLLADSARRCEFGDLPERTSAAACIPVRIAGAFRTEDLDNARR